MLSGTYQLQGEVSQRLLRVLPHLLVLPAGALDSPLIPLLSDEMTKDEPGQEVVLDRLLDLLLIAVLRAWFSRPEAAAPPGTGRTAIRWSEGRCGCCMALAHIL
ncbi:cupin domain-containing protein [Micromonospora sp. M12]